MNYCQSIMGEHFYLISHLLEKCLFTLNEDMLLEARKMKDQPITIRAVRSYSIPSLDSNNNINNNVVSDFWTDLEKSLTTAAEEYDHEDITIEGTEEEKRKGVVYL